MRKIGFAIFTGLILTACTQNSSSVSNTPPTTSPTVNPTSQPSQPSLTKTYQNSTLKYSFKLAANERVITCTVANRTIESIGALPISNQDVDECGRGGEEDAVDSIKLPNQTAEGYIKDNYDIYDLQQESITVSGQKAIRIKGKFKPEVNAAAPDETERIIFYKNNTVYDIHPSFLERDFKLN